MCSGYDCQSHILSHWLKIQRTCWLRSNKETTVSSTTSLTETTYNLPKRIQPTFSILQNLCAFINQASQIRSPKCWHLSQFLQMRWSLIPWSLSILKAWTKKKTKIKLFQNPQILDYLTGIIFTYKYCYYCTNVLHHYLFRHNLAMIVYIITRIYI